MKQTEVRHLPKSDPLEVFFLTLWFWSITMYTNESSLENHYE